VEGREVNNFARRFFPLPQVSTADLLDKAMAEKGVVLHDPRPVVSVGPVDVPLTKTAEKGCESPVTSVCLVVAGEKGGCLATATARDRNISGGYVLLPRQRQ
jgi:hypothetical protein